MEIVKILASRSKFGNCYRQRRWRKPPFTPLENHSRHP